MSGPGLDTDLGQPDQPFAQGLFIFGHEGVQLLGRRILAAHLPDLSTDRDRDTLGFDLTDEQGQLGAQSGVQGLLGLERRQVEVDERAGVDVDVVETGGHGLAREIAQGLDLGFGRTKIARGAHLEVIALDKERPAEALTDGGGEQAGDVLGRALAGVADLGAGDLEDQGPDVARDGRAENGPGAIEGHGAHVDGGYGEVGGGLAAAARHVELVDRSRPNAERLADLPQEPARRCLMRPLTERRRASQVPDALAQTSFVDDLDGAVARRSDRSAEGFEVVIVCAHDRIPLRPVYMARVYVSGLVLCQEDLRGLTRISLQSSYCHVMVPEQGRRLYPEEGSCEPERWRERAILPPVTAPYPHPTRPYTAA